MKKVIFVFTLTISLLSLATGCRAGGNLSAEQAVMNMLIAHPGEGVAIDPGSFEVLQTQVFEGSTYVLLAYQRMWKENDEQCLGMYEAKSQLITGWVAGSGGGICTERKLGQGEDNLPMHLSSLTFNRADQKKPDASYAIGKVNDPQIVKVQVVWKDGLAQEAKVIRNSFAVIRSGKAELKSADGLDAGNLARYTIKY